MKIKTLATISTLLTLTAALTAFVVLNRDKDKKNENKQTITADTLTTLQSDKVTIIDTRKINEATEKEDAKPTTDKVSYWNSFTEMKQMLTGQKQMDFKRAVFLTENLKDYLCNEVLS
ncbi:MAG: hypothetical protein FVQ77_12280 [Cytophagales bacterium]|nr:hypothetical protein [Cytophagales bacterium]